MLITGVLVLLSSLSGRAAEDPARFLAVQSWRGTFGQDTSMIGSRTTPSSSGDCLVEFSFIHHINPSGVTLSNTFGFGDLRWWLSDGVRIPNAGNVAERVTLTCPDFTSRHTADGGDVQGIFSVQVDAAATNYILQFPSIYADIAVDGEPGVEIGGFWGPMSITNDLPATGMTLSGSLTTTLDHFGVIFVPLPLPTAEVQQLLRSTALVITWSLTPFVEELEVVIESDQYEEWLPTGDLRDWNKRGEDVLFLTGKLRVKDAPEDQVPQSRAKWFKFELLDVSSQPGVCMNRPIQQSANTNPDLRFESSVNGPPRVVPALTITDAGMTAKTPDDEYLAAVAGISSFDFGSYGKLKVTAEVNGREIVGYWQNDPAREPKPLLLPRRQPESKVADKWKEDNQVGGVGDTDDDENDPVGDGHAGDGLSLYEEYRGFSENLKHVRSNPQKKDLFIADNIKSGDSMSGISLFRAQTGLEVHSQMKPEEFNISLAAGVFSSFLNFNHDGGERHLVDQHGIILLEKAVSDGVSFADADFQGGTPALYQRVYIDRFAYGWQNLRASDGGRVLTFQGAAVVAHELAHTCAVWHHGEADLESVSWVVQGTNIFENGLQIQLLYENRAPASSAITSLFHRLETNSVTRWIGMPHGQHSGDDQCLMRYTMAYAYPSRLPGENRIRYLVKEVEGVRLCTASQGTGVNGARSPQSRYQQAVSGRGNCKAQVCVNDLYNRHPSHIR